MPKTFFEAPDEVWKLKHSVVGEHFPTWAELREPLTIGLQMVVADEDKPALTKGGWPCEALVSVVPTKHRASGGPDVLIQLDGSAWRDLTEHQKRALLHHELLHIELVDVKTVYPDEGEPYRICKLDSLRRPVVKLRKHDYECGGFRKIHELYGEDSPEHRQLEVATTILAQQVFPFAKAV